MSYVYKYLNPNGIVVYVGKTGNIDARAKQHLAVDGWCDNTLLLQYTECSCQAEMDALETLLIGNYIGDGGCIYNSAKTWNDYRKPKWICVNEIQWKNYNNPVPKENVGKVNHMWDMEPDSLSGLKIGNFLYKFLIPKPGRKSPAYGVSEYGSTKRTKVVKNRKYIEDDEYYRFSKITGREIYYDEEYDGVNGENDPVLAMAYSCKRQQAKAQKQYIVDVFGIGKYREFKNNTYKYFEELEKRNERLRKEGNELRTMIVPLDLLPDTPIMAEAQLEFYGARLD